MKVIFLKDVQSVGRKYDIKNVADGYALNMLLPKKLVEIATPQAIKKIEEMKANDLTQKRIQEELLQKNLEAINSIVVTIKGKANEKGHLFAGITKEMLISEIQKVSRLNIDPELIVLPKPIKEVGEHKITIQAGNKKAELTLVVESI
ncbi:MAG: ribosomal protein L9 [Parcubacteria bacterium C7867-006]|nr:MAG: ribosomal protein L9 [Parcubacteria bacterium C7867-006]